MEIWQQGIVLWDARRFALARPKAATPEERRELSLEYFEHWFGSAGGFFAHFEFACSRGDNSIAAFLLHQSAERYFAAALLVFTGTKPTTHDLQKNPPGRALCARGNGGASLGVKVSCGS